MSPRSMFGPLLCCGLLLLAIGCSKKKSADELGGGGDGDIGEVAITARVPGDGSVVRGTHTVDLKGEFDLRDKDGKRLPNRDAREDIKEEISFRETIDSFPDGAAHPAKARITFDKWERKEPRNNAEIKVDPKRPDFKPVVGNEITYEYHRGFADIRFTSGGELDWDVRWFIDKRHDEKNREFDARIFLPSEPVRSGSSWPVSGRKLMRAIGPGYGVPVDDKKSKSTARLVRVWNDGGAKYGRIETGGTFVVDPGKDKVTIHEIRIDLKWVVELCIDGSRHDIKATAKVDVYARFTSPDRSGTVSMAGTVTITETEETIGKAASPPWQKTPTAADPDDSEPVKKKSTAPAPIKPVEPPDEGKIELPRDVPPKPRPKR